MIVNEIETKYINKKPKRLEKSCVRSNDVERRSAGDGCGVRLYRFNAELCSYKDAIIFYNLVPGLLLSSTFKDCKTVIKTNIFRLYLLKVV